MRASSPSNTTRRICEVFVNSLNLQFSASDLDYTQTLDQYAGLDSLAILEFVGALEREFGITIEPELLRLEFVRDLQELSVYIDARVAQFGGAPKP
jgi:acyl carrier protein